MALAAGQGRLGEIHMEHGALQVGRLMAIGTLHCAMRAYERELGRRVIEPRHVFPFLGGVARFASERSALGILSGHALGKFAVVDVFVTRRAAELREMVKGLGVGGRRFVAIVAGHRDVTAGEREVALLVLVDGIVGHLPGIAVVTLLAAVLPWIAGELSFVLVLVAVGAERELQFVFCFLTCRHVACGTFDVGMWGNERVFGLGVVGGREG